MDSINISIGLNNDQINDNDLKENIEELQRVIELKRVKGLQVEFDSMTRELDITFESCLFENNKHNSRGGGRRKAFAESQTEKELSITGRERKKRYNYSNIVYELNSGASVADMLSFTNMTQATYYRHLQAMKESTYYNSLDPDRINDVEYLESIKGNHYF